MDNFIVSARKYRPRVFDDVIGQQAIANTLKRAIVNHKLAGAYLFCGPRGVGKTTCARIFAKAINCLNPQENGEACNECESCKSFNEGRSVNVQELNAAANNSVEDIRAIIDQVRIPPQLGKYKVIILDEVHMLSAAASNALLKTLEEPPSYVIFILATTEKQKILPTILSRCQIFDFNRMEVENIIQELKMVAENENIEYEESALNLIAQKADGGMRDSLSIFDQVASFSAGKITYENALRCLNVLDYEYYFKMTDMLLNHEVSQAMLLFNEVVSKGFDGGIFISGLASHFRDLLVSQHAETATLLDASNEIKARYTEQAKKCTAPFLFKAIRICDRCGNAYKISFNKRLSVEIALIEVAQIGTPNELDEEGAGRRPAHTLKPIFKETNKQISNPSTQNKVSSPQVTETKTATPNNVVNKAQESVQPQVIRSTGNLNNAAILQAMNRFSIKAAANTTPTEPKTPVTTPVASTPVYTTQTIQTEKTEQTVQPETPVTNIPNEPEVVLNETQLNVHWKTFVETLPQEHRDIQGRMNGMTLHLDPSGTISTLVNTEEVKNYMKPIIKEAEQYLQRKFNKANIHIEVNINPEQEQDVKYDVYKYFEELKKDNPALARLCQDIGLKVD